MVSRLGNAIVGGLTSLALAACGGGGDDDSSQCTPPNIQGSPVFQTTTGQGQAHGSGQLPAGIPNGMDFEVLVDAGDFSSSIFPDSFAGNETCGRSFSYTARELAPGTYTIDYAVYKPGSDAIEPAYMGKSTNQFTITSNENVAFNPTY